MDWRRRARSASASSSAAERRPGRCASSGSAPSGGGRGVGFLRVSAGLPSAGVGRMRNRRRYWRSQRGPQNQPDPSRKTPPAARSSSSVSPAMEVRQPVQWWPCGTSSCLAARERIHFITTASTPVSPAPRTTVDRPEARPQLSHHPPGDCTPRGVHDLCHRPRGSGSASHGFSWAGRAPRQEPERGKHDTWSLNPSGGLQKPPAGRFRSP